MSFSKKKRYRWRRRDISGVTSPVFLISQTSHPLQTLHPQPHVPCKEGRALGKQKEGTKRNVAKAVWGKCCGRLGQELEPA